VNLSRRGGLSAQPPCCNCPGFSAYRKPGPFFGDSHDPDPRPVHLRRPWRWPLGRRADLDSGGVVMGDRKHRLQGAYPLMWNSIDGAVRDAMNAHPDIQIPAKRISSIVKRATGAVLALQEAGAGKPAEKSCCHLQTERPGRSSSQPSRGLADLQASPTLPENEK